MSRLKIKTMTVCVCVPVFLYPHLIFHMAVGSDFSGSFSPIKKKRSRARERERGIKSRVNYHLFLLPFKREIKAAPRLPLPPLHTPLPPTTIRAGLLICTPYSSLIGNLHIHVIQCRHEKPIHVHTHAHMQQ